MNDFVYIQLYGPKTLGPGGLFTAMCLLLGFVGNNIVLYP